MFHQPLWRWLHITGKTKKTWPPVRRRVTGPASDLALRASSALRRDSARSSSRRGSVQPWVRLVLRARFRVGSIEKPKGPQLRGALSRLIGHIFPDPSGLPPSTAQTEGLRDTAGCVAFAFGQTPRRARRSTPRLRSLPRGSRRLLRQLQLLCQLLGPPQAGAGSFEAGGKIWFKHHLHKKSS